MTITGSMRRLSLIGIDAIWRLSFKCLLMRIIASFLCSGYLNFINDPISSVILLILVHVLLPSCLNHVIKYCTTVYERNGKIFGLFKI